MIQRTAPSLPQENSVGRFQCKGGEERYIKPTIGNKILHETNNNNNGNFSHQKT
jgi:hypothetical protein